MTWTTWDLVVAGGVGLLLGLWMGLNADLWWEKLRTWWRFRRAKDVAHGHLEKAKHAWALTEEQEATAEIMADRWLNERCVFCGRDSGNGPRCDAQVEFALRHGTPTWESEDFETILAYVLLGGNEEVKE